MAISEKEIYESVRELITEVRDNHEETIKKINKLDEKFDKLMKKLNEVDKISLKTNNVVSGLADAA